MSWGRLLCCTGVLTLLFIRTLPAGAQSDTAGPRVLVTTTQIRDFVLNVGAGRLAVTSILQGDDDPHEYQPTVADLRSIAAADVIFANGVGLEHWFDRLAQNVRPGAIVVRLGDESGITLRRTSGQDADPHVWFDPTYAELMVVRIRDTLSAVDPAGAATYAGNAAAYVDQLAELDADIMRQWTLVPADQRKLVTNHDVFGYYVDRYGLSFIGSIIPSSTTEAEPSAAEIQRLILTIRAQRVRSIFTESSLNPRLAQQVSQQAGVRIYSNLYGDSLGRPGSEGDTYLRMMRFNTRVMTEGMTR